MRNTRHMFHVATILTVLALALAACTGGSPSPPGPAASASSTPSTQNTVMVALVTDTSNPNNSGFNQLATTGYTQAQKQYGFPSSIIQASTPNDYVNALAAAAQQANLVIAVGPALQVPLDKVARNFPAIKFAMVDGCALIDPIKTACDPLPNVAPLSFNVQQAGCIVGALAAQMEVDGKAKAPKLLGKNTIGAIGAQPIPSVMKYLAGYQYCAKRVDPTINVMIGYSNDFTNPSTCQALAEDQVASQHVDIIFQIASACGTGVLDAASEKNIYSIGSDVDQGKDASGKTRASVITSALKNVDTAVYTIINKAENNQYEAFVKNPDTFDLASDGVDFATPSPAVPHDATARALAYKNEMKRGSLTPPGQLPN